MPGICSPSHFERCYHILYNNKSSQSLIITRLLLIVSSFNYFFYLDLLYIHALTFKETFRCFCTGVRWHITKPVYKQSFKIPQTLCAFSFLTVPFCILNTYTCIYWLSTIKMLSGIA